MRLACTITSHPGPVPALTITGLEIDQTCCASPRAARWRTDLQPRRFARSYRWSSLRSSGSTALRKAECLLPAMRLPVEPRLRRPIEFSCELMARLRSEHPIQ